MRIKLLDFNFRVDLLFIFTKLFFIYFIFLFSFSLNAQNTDSSTSFQKKQQVEVFVDELKELGYFLTCTNPAPSPSHLFSTIDVNLYLSSEDSLKEAYASFSKVPFYNLENDPIIFALSIDPLAEQYPSESPYNAMGNNPINMIDPNGAEVVSLVHGEIVDAEHPGAKQGDLSDDGSQVYLGDEKNGAWIPIPSDRELHNFRLKIGEGIVAARIKGYNHSANNLKYWLSGKGGTYNEDANWLRKSEAVRQTIHIKNMMRFIENPKNNGLVQPSVFNLSDGESIVVNDYWDAVVSNNLLYAFGNISDYLYAWGDFTITTQGNLTISRQGDELLITGTLKNTFFDSYDWNLGMSIKIGSVKVDDTSMRLYEVLKGAAPFKGTSSWTEDINIRIPFNPDSDDFMNRMKLSGAVVDNYNKSSEK